MRHNQRNQPQEGPVLEFLMGQFAAACFALPTSALLWFTTNKHLAIWGPADAFIGSNGFWLVLGVFGFVSVFMPALFPALLGKVWRGIIQWERWF